MRPRRVTLTECLNPACDWWSWGAYDQCPECHGEVEENEEAARDTLAEMRDEEEREP